MWSYEMLFVIQYKTQISINNISKESCFGLPLSWSFLTNIILIIYYYSAVKRLIASKIKVFVYIIYVCVCTFIM